METKDSRLSADTERLEWRLIENAPHDGTEIILAEIDQQGNVDRLDVGSWEQIDDEGISPKYYDWKSDYGIETPTHWIPMPDSARGATSGEVKEEDSGSETPLAQAGGEPLGQSERYEVKRIEAHFERMHQQVPQQWMVSDIFDDGKSWGVLSFRNEIIFGLSWHLTREECENLVTRHGALNTSVEGDKKENHDDTKRCKCVCGIGLYGAVVLM